MLVGVAVGVKVKVGRGEGTALFMGVASWAGSFFGAEVGVGLRRKTGVEGLRVEKTTGVCVIAAFGISAVVLHPIERKAIQTKRAFAYFKFSEFSEKKFFSTVHS